MTNIRVPPVRTASRPAGSAFAASQGCHLVPRPLADHLSLGLGEAHQHAKGKSTHCLGGEVIPDHADERCLRLLEPDHQSGKVEQGAGEAVCLVVYGNVFKLPIIGLVAWKQNCLGSSPFNLDCRQRPDKATA